MKYITDNGVTYTEEDIEESTSWLKISLQSNLIARKFGENAGYIVGLGLDEQLQEALSLFDRFETLDEMFAYAESQKVANK